MKIIIRIQTLIFILSITFISCNIYKQKQTENTVKDLAAHLNKIFITSRENVELRKNMVENIYSNIDKYNLSIKGLDVSEGGAFTWYEDYAYYQKVDKYNGEGMIAFFNGRKGVYIDPHLEYKPENFKKARKLKRSSPEIIQIKKEIRLWELILFDLINAGKKIEYKNEHYFCRPQLWLFAQNLFYDYPSTITPNLTQTILGNLEWCANGSWNNLDGKPKWSKIFVSLQGFGWLKSVSVPFFVNGKFHGFLIDTLFPLDISNKKFKNNDKNVMFLSSDLSLLGISKAAKNILKIEEITDFLYLEQILDNINIKDKFKLSHQSQELYIQEIGRKILIGKKEFIVTIQKIKYKFFVEKIAEVDFYVVGFSRE